MATSSSSNNSNINNVSVIFSYVSGERKTKKEIAIEPFYEKIPICSLEEKFMPSILINKEESIKDYLRQKNEKKYLTNTCISTLTEKKYFPYKYFLEKNLIDFDRNLSAIKDEKKERLDLLKLAYNVNILTLSIIPVKNDFLQTFYQGRKYDEFKPNDEAIKILFGDIEFDDSNEMNSEAFIIEKDQKRSKVRRFASSHIKGVLKKDSEKICKLRGFIAPWADFESSNVEPTISFEDGKKRCFKFDPVNLENNIIDIHSELLRERLIKLLKAFEKDQEALAIYLTVIDNKDLASPIKQCGWIK